MSDLYENLEGCGFSLEEDKKLLNLYAERVDALSKKYFASSEAEAELDELEKSLGLFFPIGKLQALIERYNSRLNKLVRQDIIEILDRLGLKKVTTESGIEIAKDTAYNTKIMDKTAFFLWVEENGYSAFIKDHFDFNKGVVDDSLLNFLNEGGYDYKREQDIHYQTLKKLMKDHILAGGDLPPESAAQVDKFDYAKVSTKNKQ